MKSEYLNLSENKAQKSEWKMYRADNILNFLMKLIQKRKVGLD